MLTSYALLHLVDTDVEARIGAGAVDEVLACAPPCSVAVFVREPATPPLRIRFCAMTLSEEGLVPAPSHPSERVGAWLRVLSIVDRAATILATLTLSHDDTIDDCWVRPVRSTRWQKVGRLDGIGAVDPASSEPGDTALFIRGPRGDVDELLAAIAHTESSSTNRPD